MSVENEDDEEEEEENDDEEEDDDLADYNDDSQVNYLPFFSSAISRYSDCLPLTCFQHTDVAPLPQHLSRMMMTSL